MSVMSFMSVMIQVVSIIVEVSSSSLFLIKACLRGETFPSKCLAGRFPVSWCQRLCQLHRHTNPPRIKLARTCLSSKSWPNEAWPPYRAVMEAGRPWRTWSTPALGRDSAPALSCSCTSTSLVSMGELMSFPSPVAWNWMNWELHVGFGHTSRSWTHPDLQWNCQKSKSHIGIYQSNSIEFNWYMVCVSSIFLSLSVRISINLSACLTGVYACSDYRWQLLCILWILNTDIVHTDMYGYCSLLRLWVQ